MRTLIYKIVQRKPLMASASLLWLLFLITLSVIPYSPGNIFTGPDTTFRWDYLEHYTGYLLLGLLFILWRSDRDMSITLSVILMITAAGVLISFVLEYIQLYIPGRAFNMIDVAFNTAGLVSGVLIAYFAILKVLKHGPLPPQ
jgi:VanZ family protein